MAVGDEEVAEVVAEGVASGTNEEGLIEIELEDAEDVVESVEVDIISVFFIICVSQKLHDTSHTSKRGKERPTKRSRPVSDTGG